MNILSSFALQQYCRWAYHFHTHQGNYFSFLILLRHIRNSRCMALRSFFRIPCLNFTKVTWLTSVRKKRLLFQVLARWVVLKSLGKTVTNHSCAIGWHIGKQCKLWILNFGKGFFFVCFFPLSPASFRTISVILVSRLQKLLFWLGANENRVSC